MSVPLLLLMLLPDQIGKVADLPYLGLLAVSVVMGGAVCLNAMSFDSMRVRAALDSGARLWHLLITKNLALVAIVAPIGFLLSALLAWRAGNLAAFFKACALMISFIVLWLGVGNVLSVVVPIRDEPILNRRKDGTLRQFAIAFAVSYAIGYLVNLMLLWRAFAAQEMATRLGSAVLPAILVVLSSIAMWILLTVVAVEANPTNARPFCAMTSAICGIVKRCSCTWNSRSRQLLMAKKSSDVVTGSNSLALSSSACRQRRRSSAVGR